MTPRDEHLFAEFTSRCAEARGRLREHMAERGLRAEDGWRIHEFTRESDGQVQLVMRPVHSQLGSPGDLECNCTIDEPGSNISADCRT